MVDELMRAFRNRSDPAPAAPIPSPHVTLAAVNPAPKPETLSEPPPPAPSAPDTEVGEEDGGCFATARGQVPRGFRIRAGDRYYSCQYLAFLRTGELSGWDTDIGKEVLYVIFHWGTLLITGKGLAALDDLLNEHKVTRLSLGEGKHGVRIDDIRILPREAGPVAPARRAKSA